MSSHNNHEEYDPVANLHMQPTKSILKSTKSIDDPGQDVLPETNHGMTRSESKSHKIPHFDEMNIIATYHPPDKDYGHMKIEEPKTPYAPNDIIDEEVTSEDIKQGVDPNALTQRLNESNTPSSSATRLRSDRFERRSIDEDVEPSPEELEHRKQFEMHRKKHYNEFEIVRLRKKEIEDELRALEQEDSTKEPSGKSADNISSFQSSSFSSDPIKPILVHHQSKDSSNHHHYHVHVEDDHHHDKYPITPEEQERKRQFELKRKKHYDEFRTTRSADDDDDEPNKTTG